MVDSYNIRQIVFSKFLLIYIFNILCLHALWMAMLVHIMNLSTVTRNGVPTHVEWDNRVEKKW
jgi:hypothetical protein